MTHIVLCSLGFSPTLPNPTLPIPTLPIPTLPIPTLPNPTSPNPTSPNPTSPNPISPNTDYSDGSTTLTDLAVESGASRAAPPIFISRLRRVFNLSALTTPPPTIDRRVQIHHVILKFVVNMLFCITTFRLNFVVSKIMQFLLISFNKSI